eukprot:TRINITY_DN20802_c0_g1_i1.p1 TRINITY_DN20802_c0_g1~~TRINITY_DN20802_c0_g1_i1.p1  ORF type:complete len:410 (-),score=107.34 TRINITY_DN20802_c0_g1_i1:450-1679(-)
MAHGEWNNRRRGRGEIGGFHGRGRGRGLNVRREDEKKHKIASVKNQIRSIERLLRKDLRPEVVAAQGKRLEDLKKIQEEHARSDLERKLALRYRRVKFFERRKVERRIRRVEKQQRLLDEHEHDAAARERSALAKQLVELKNDLEYVKYFPKTEKYVSIFMGNDNEDVIARRNELRTKIKANLAAAAAAGIDLEEGSGSEDDGLIDMSEDDFFMAGSSSDDADADDEWDDKSPRDDTSREVTNASPRERTVSSRKKKGGEAHGDRHAPDERRPPRQEHHQRPHASQEELRQRPQGQWQGAHGGRGKYQNGRGGAGGRGSVHGRGRGPAFPGRGWGAGDGGGRGPVNPQGHKAVVGGRDASALMPPPKPRGGMPPIVNATVTASNAAGPSNVDSETKPKRKRTRKKKSEA